MSGVRQSMVFALEDEFGKGKGANKSWIRPPPGTQFSNTHAVSTARIDTMGCKQWDTVAYGRMSGSWTWEFTFDYEYLEPFLLAFEGYELKDIDVTTNTALAIVTGKYFLSNGTIDGEAADIPDFFDSDDKNIKNQTLELTKGAPVDVTIYVPGEIVSVSEPPTGVKVTMNNGVNYTNHKGEFVNASSITLYGTPEEEITNPVDVSVRYDREMSIGFKISVINSTTESSQIVKVHEFKKTNYCRIPSFAVRRVILHQIAGGPDDEVDYLYGCVCKSIRFTQSAGGSQVKVSMSGSYADDEIVKENRSATDYTDYEGELVEFQCLFVDNKTKKEGETLEDYVNDGTYVANTDSISISIDNSSAMLPVTCSPVAPAYYEGKSTYQMTTSCYANDPSKYKQRVYSGGIGDDDLRIRKKGKKPIPRMTVLSYSGVREGAESIANTVAKSKRWAHFDVSKCVVKSVTWQNGDGSRLQDQISSAECRGITLTVYNKDNTGNIKDAPKHTVNVV